jgi:hypothetical protein
MAAHNVLQKTVAVYWLLESPIDSRKRIKTPTNSDLQKQTLPALPAQTFAHHYIEQRFIECLA